MILGIGNDLVHVKRIEACLARFGEKFESRIFTSQEQARAHTRPQIRNDGPARSYAKRFAAKEAFAKAIGTGISKRIVWRDIEVMNLTSGRPHIRLSGIALERLRMITPPNMLAHVELALTDDADMALAFVVIWAAPL